MNPEAAWLAILGQQERAMTYAAWQARLNMLLLGRIDSWMDLLWENRTLMVEAGLFDQAMDDVMDLIELAEQQVEASVAVLDSNVTTIRDLIGATD